jgi:hypothetical protein
MMLRVEQGKGGKDRHAMLSPQLLELLRDWWRIARPQVWLFPGLDLINPMSTHQSLLPRGGPVARSPSASLIKFLRQYPDIKVEISIDYGLTNIAAQRFDASVRAGEQVAKDMIAVHIEPDIRMAVVGAPSYFRKRPEPKRPQGLIGHNCITPEAIDERRRLASLIPDSRDFLARLR